MKYKDSIKANYPDMNSDDQVFTTEEARIEAMTAIIKAEAALNTAIRVAAKARYAIPYVTANVRGADKAVIVATDELAKLKTLYAEQF